MATGYNADAKITIGTSVDVGGINSGLNKIERSFKKISKLTLGILGVKAFVKFSSAALEAASDLTEVQNIIDVTFKSADELGNIIEDDSWKIENFAKTAIDNFGMSELAAKQTAGSFAAMGNSMGLTRDEATSMAVELTALTGDFASFYNISQDYARVALSAVYTGETETLKRYGIVLTEANLQEYAQSQGIAESVKNMSAREKLILRYNYIQSVTNDIDGDFVRTQGTWANQTKVLQQRWRQFLIVLGNGLMTVLLPMVKGLNQLLSATIKFANAMGSLLSRLFGIKWQQVSDAQGSAAGTASDAADAEEDLADATSDAAKAADKALGAYDKLNVIQQDTSKSSGAGAGAGGMDLDFSDLIADSNLLDDITNKLKVDFNNLYEAGKYISTNLTNALNSIPWDDVYQGAATFGTGLAEFLNGLISPELFYAVGRTIANSLNTALTFAINFSDTFDWDNFGESVAEGINGFFENFDFKKLAKGINSFVQGGVKAIATFLANIDWIQVIVDMFDFLTNIDPLTALELMSLPTVLPALIFNALIKKIFGVDLIQLAKDFGKTVWQALSDNFFDTFEDSFELADISGEFFSNIKEAIDNKDWAGVAKDILMGLATGLGALAEFLLAPITHLGNFILETIFGFFGIDASGTDAIAMSDIGKLLVQSLGNGVTLVGDTLQTVFDDVLSPVLSIVNNFVGTVMDIFGDIIFFIGHAFKGDWKDAWEDVKNIFGDLFGGIFDIAKGVVNMVIGVVNSMLGALEKGLNFVIKAVNKLSFDVPDWIPGIGGNTFGFNLNEFELPRIPKLAKGAVIPPNKEFMAVLGDQKQGTNIETPLSTMIEAFTAALDARGGSTNNQPIILQLPNGKVIAELVWSEEEKRYKQTGSYRPKYS